MSGEESNVELVPGEMVILKHKCAEPDCNGASFCLILEGSKSYELCAFHSGQAIVERMETHPAPVGVGGVVGMCKHCGHAPVCGSCGHVMLAHHDQGCIVASSNGYICPCSIAATEEERQPK